MTEVSFLTADGKIVISRSDGRNATLSRPGEPDRYVALHRRDTDELLAEELRRLDPDEVYGETLAELAVSQHDRGRTRSDAISVPQILIHHDGELLAKAVAARLVTRLVDAVAAKGMASVVLTGGGIGTKVLAELAAAPARDAVDWRRVEIWWGDERFVPTGDPERNETGARSALLDHVDVDPSRVHPMPGPDGPDGPDPEAAAERYAGWLRAAAEPQDRSRCPEVRRADARHRSRCPRGLALSRAACTV